jgi:hypothetical protein
MIIRALEDGNSDLSVLCFDVVMILPVPGHLIRNSIELPSARLAIGQYGLHLSVFSIERIVEYDGASLTRVGSE